MPPARIVSKPDQACVRLSFTLPVERPGQVLFPLSPVCPRTGVISCRETVIHSLSQSDVPHNSSSALQTYDLSCPSRVVCICSAYVHGGMPPACIVSPDHACVVLVRLSFVLPVEGWILFPLGPVCPCTGVISCREVVMRSLSQCDVLHNTSSAFRTYDLSCPSHIACMCANVLASHNSKANPSVKTLLSRFFLFFQSILHRGYSHDVFRQILFPLSPVHPHTGVISCREIVTPLSSHRDVPHDTSSPF